MKNLNPKTFALFIFGLFAICFVGLAYFKNVSVSDKWTALKLAYDTIPILITVCTLFATYAWKWPIFQTWLVPFPNLNGTWQGIIQTTWKDPNTGNIPGPIPVVLTIKQTFTHVSCVMRTAEMISRSYLADFWLDDAEQIKKLGYCYSNIPDPSVSIRSERHDGTMSFDITGTSTINLSGSYWTTRRTTGTVSLSFRSHKPLDKFPDDLGEHPMKGR